ncbi:hypothetical protein [Bacillus weihaiensis]|uniref:hypothetical protein n=1 Tax=Bacillus weihaiensis TaxID=1547283 RepID=UPI002355E661|nr:hypothetical protein [Bacillus weihaiensis]
MSWKNIKIEKINSIEKLVAEFDITALDLLSDVFENDANYYGGFKVKVYETQDQNSLILTGYTNLKILDLTGHYEGAVGFGNTIEDALEDTLNQFIKKLNNCISDKGSLLTLNNFKIVSYDEF